MKKDNLFSLLSLLIGIACIFLGLINNPSLIVMCTTFIVSISGTIFAFVGRLHEIKKNIKVLYLATIGLYLNIISLFGTVGFYVFDKLGRPSNFGIDKSTDSRMIILIITNICLIILSCLVALTYNFVVKKSKKSQQMNKTNK